MRSRSIHEASLKVLEEIGMDFMLAEARDLLKQAGAKVERRARALRPRHDRGGDAHRRRERFTFHARNPENDFELGGDAMTFGTVAARPTAPTWTAGGAPAISPTTGTS